jgi:hypothetical protein
MPDGWELLLAPRARDLLEATAEEDVSRLATEQPLTTASRFLSSYICTYSYRLPANRQSRFEQRSQASCNRLPLGRSCDSKGTNGQEG